MLPTRDITQANNSVKIAKQWYYGNHKFGVNGEFLKLLRDNVFQGFNNENADEHMEMILEIAKLYKTKSMTYNQFMLRVFPNTLAGEAMHWLDFEFDKPLTSWVELKIKILEKFSREFTYWLKSKFLFPEWMNSSLKNELWTYWRTGNDKRGNRQRGM